MCARQLNTLVVFPKFDGACRQWSHLADRGGVPDGSKSIRYRTPAALKNSRICNSEHGVSEVVISSNAPDERSAPCESMREISAPAP